MKKQIIKINEVQLRKIVKESVKKILNEEIEVNEETVSSVIKDIYPNFEITDQGDFLCVELDTSYYKTFNECSQALKNVFEPAHKVTGDAMMNSIYISY